MTVEIATSKRASRYEQTIKEKDERIADLLLRIENLESELAQLHEQICDYEEELQNANQ